MKATCRVLYVFLLSHTPLLTLGCDRGGDTSDTADSSEHNSTSGMPMATCEVTSVVDLADADEVAPNGRTAAEVLAAIPESFETTLHWDLSNRSVEVEVDKTVGQSSSMSLTFTLPSSPKFYFEERTVSSTSSEGPEVICDDYVKTTVDIHAETQDGALVFDLPDVEVKLGPDNPSVGYFASPFALTTQSLTSPAVDFVAPIAQPADIEKDVALSFDDPEVTGDLTVYATDSSGTYQIVIARW